MLWLLATLLGLLAWYAAVGMRQRAKARTEKRKMEVDQAAEARAREERLIANLSWVQRRAWLARIENGYDVETIESAASFETPRSYWPEGGLWDVDDDADQSDWSEDDQKRLDAVAAWNLSKLDELAKYPYPGSRAHKREEGRRFGRKMAHGGFLPPDEPPTESPS